MLKKVSPSNGYALVTAFSLTALNWVDTDLPLSYIFGTVDVAAVDPAKPRGATVALSTARPFGGAGPAATYPGVTLSAGTRLANYSVRKRANASLSPPFF